MGLYYHSFLNKMKNEYKKSKLCLRDFMDQIAPKIYKEFDITPDSLHWALNIDKFLEDLNEITEPEFSLAKKVLKENNDLWEKEGFNFLKKDGEI